MKSVLRRPPPSRKLDAPALRHAEVGAFAHHLGAQFDSRDAHGVVGAIAGISVSLRGCTHVSADATEPEQVGLALENGADQLGRRERGNAQPQQLLHLRAERNRLGCAREDAAALGDLRLVVVLPARARHVEQTLALGQPCGRIRIGVEEDVAVIEGRHQPDFGREQHAVAEHVARHVADTNHAERLALDVDIHLAEVALHALPGTTRGDRHLLVVVAGRSTRGEGIAEPEAVCDRNLVGDVGERGRTLVGRHHQIGIIAVVAHHARRRHDRAILDVVGDAEQRGNENAVGGDALGLHGVAPARARHLLGQEAALGAGRHDHRVLHALRTHQAQDLRPEVLCAVRPPDAAARRRPEAQMHAFHARRVDPDLAVGSRLRRRVHGLAVELEGDRLRRPPVGAGLVVVGAHRRADQAQELPEDAILIQARHGPQRTVDALADRRLGRLAILQAGLARRIETQVEQLHQIARHAGVAMQRVGQIAQPEWRAELTQVGCIRPQHGCLAPVSTGRNDQSVEAIIVGATLEDRQKRLLQPSAVHAKIDGVSADGLQRHIMQRHLARALAVARRDAIGALVDRREAEVLQDRHALRQLHGRTEAVDRGVHAAGLAVEVDGDWFVRPQSLDALDVLQRPLRRNVSA